MHTIQFDFAAGAGGSAGLFDHLLSAAAFDALAEAHRRATGFALCAVDADGRVLRGECGAHPASAGVACRPFFAQAVAEALRWGEPAVSCCACGRAVWAVPVMRNQRVAGGLLVAGVALRRPRRPGTLDRAITSAGRHLLQLATDHNLTNAALLAERRLSARRESERAEAMEVLKRPPPEDVHAAFLQERPGLLAAIRCGERREARRILNRVLVSVYAAGQGDFAVLKSLALELIVMMTHAATQAGGDAEKLPGLSCRSMTAFARISDQEALAAWLCDLLERLIDVIERGVRRPQSVSLARAMDYIERHLGEDVDRDQVARVAGVSPSHFSRLMRASTGSSFTDLVTRLRLEQAAHLLAHTDLELAQVALECGFGDQSYFGRVFRKRLGQTPHDYRRGRGSAAPKSQKTARKSKPPEGRACYNPSRSSPVSAPLDDHS